MKTKITVWLIILLVILNLASIFVFWLGRERPHPLPPGGTPKDYIINELALNASQQKQYAVLVSQHRQAAEKHQDSIMLLKDAFFNLLKNAGVTESEKTNAASAISKETEKLDLLTFDHFQKVRMICTDVQKKKFDVIIHQVLEMMGRPKPPGNGPAGPNGRSAGRHRGMIGPPPPDGPPDRNRPHPGGPPPGGSDERYGPPPPGGPSDENGPPPRRDGMPPPPQ